MLLKDAGTVNVENMHDLLAELQRVFLLLGIRLERTQLESIGECFVCISIHTGQVIPLPTMFDRFTGVTHLTLQPTYVTEKKDKRSKITHRYQYLDAFALGILQSKAESIVQEFHLLQGEINETSTLLEGYFIEQGKPLGITASPIERDHDPADFFGLTPREYLIQPREKPKTHQISILTANGSQSPLPKYLHSVRAITVIPTLATPDERQHAIINTKTYAIENGLIQKQDEVLALDKTLLALWSTHPTNAIEIHARVHNQPEGTNIEPSLDEVTDQVFEYLIAQTEGLPFTFERMPIATTTDSSEADLFITMPEIRVIPHHKTSNIDPQTSTSLWGWKAPGKKQESPTDVTPYDTVVGIKIVTNDTNLRDRKDVSREALFALKNSFATPASGIVMTVDHRLLMEWQTMEKPPFPNIDEMMEIFGNKTAKRQSDYGINIWRQRDEPPIVKIDWFEPHIGSYIGAPHLRVMSVWDKTYADAILIDWGWIFSQWKARSILDFPKPKNGIAPFLREQMFRPIPRIFRTDLLILSIDSAMLDTIFDIASSSSTRTSSVDQFVLLEAYHRLGEEQLVEILLSQEKTREYTKKLQETGKLSIIMRHIAEREKEVYASKVVYRGLWITHAHQDHTIGSSSIRASIPRIVSDETMTFLETDFMTSSMFHIAETAFYRNYLGKKEGNSYPVSHFPFIIMHDGERIEIAPEFFLTAHKGLHSIPGELSPVWAIYHHKKLVSSGAYSGDDKDGTFYRNVQRHTQEYNEPVDVVFTEGTNDMRTTKKGAYTKESDVKNAFSDQFQRMNEERALAIVDVLKNNYERIFSVVEEAQKAGRTCIISPKIIFRCLRLSLRYNGEIENREPRLARFFELIAQGKIKSWKRNIQNYRGYEKRIIDTVQKVDADQLSALAHDNPENFVLIRELGESSDNLEGITAQKVYWIQSTYAAYDRLAKEELQAKRDFAVRKNFTFINEGFHTSGHGVLLSSDHPQADGGIVDELSKINTDTEGNRIGPDEVVVVHTQSREFISRQIFTTYKGLQHTHIHERVDHPVPMIIPKTQFLRFLPQRSRR